MHVLDHLQARGFIQQTTDIEALKAAFDAGMVTFYVGFDPTADSLHVGHLLPVMAMSWLQRAGHRPIVVLGGGTAMVGDPTGKDRTREMLTPERIDHNMACQKVQFARYLDIAESPEQATGHQAIMVNNGEWLCALGYVDFLRDIGRHFSVNRMLTAESTKQRLERNQGLSFIEFNYHLLQSYDFLVLYDRFECTLQVGGDDQWFNILGGTDLIRRTRQTTAHAMTVPLLATADGKKMGKTEKGAVFLDPEMLSVYDFFQYWINVQDADVLRLLKLYTHLPLERIAELEALEGAGLREAKRLLALETTTLAHGREAAEDAAFVSEALFAKGRELSAEDKERMLKVLRGSGAFENKALTLPAPILEVLVDSGLCSSRGEARRLVKQGGARIWDQRVSDPETTVSSEAIVWAGKKKAALIVRA